MAKGWKVKDIHTGEITSNKKCGKVMKVTKYGRELGHKDRCGLQAFTPGVLPECNEEACRQKVKGEDGQAQA